jgi:hypothetical protein
LRSPFVRLICAIATERASLGSFLLTWPVSSRRTRAASSGHVQDVFTGSEQLLSEQMSQAAGPFDCPTPFGPPLGPLQQAVDLPDRSPHAQLPEFGFGRVERERCV